MRSSNFAEVNNTRLYYEEAGSGSPIVLVHGLGGDCRVWEGQVEVIARRYRVICYDIRGHGKSALPLNDPYSHADDLKALLDYLGVIRPAIVVGHSMGGGIAIDFALTYPDALRALVLVASTVAGYTWSSAWNEAWALVFGDPASNVMEHALPMLLDHPMFANTRQQPDVMARLADILLGYSGWHIVNDDPLVELDPPAIDRLGEIRAPTLVMLGAGDFPDLHNIAGILHKGIRGARLVELPGVGHVPPMEAPEKFNQAVLEFLTGL